MPKRPADTMSVESAFATLRDKLALGGVRPFVLTPGALGGTASPDSPDPCEAWLRFPVDRVHPTDLPILRRNVQKTLTDPARGFHAEYRIRSEAGVWEWEWAFGSTEQSNGGKVLRISGFRRIAPWARAESADKLVEAVLRGLPGRYLVLDREGRAVHWNARFAATFRVEDGVCDSQRLFSSVCGEFVDFVEAVCVRGTGSIEAWLEQNDGTLGRFHCAGQMVEYEGRPYAVCLLMDVTGHHKTEVNLRLERARLSTLINAARLGTWDYDAETQNMTYNKRWADLYGLSMEEINGSATAWEQYVHPEDKPALQAAVIAHVEKVTPYYSAQYRIIRKDGQVVHVQDYGRVVGRGEDGKATRIMGGIQDITALKEAQAELLRSKLQLELIIEEVGIGLWDWDVVRDVSHGSPSAFSRLGYPKEALPHSFGALEALVHPEDRELHREALLGYLDGKTDAFSCEWRAKSAAGDWVWFFSRGYAVEWDKQGRVTHMVGGHFNIQAVKEQAEKEREALELIARQKRELEGSVAERTRLLDRVQERLADILTEGVIPATFPEGVDCILLQDKVGAFEQSLNQAFDMITENMRWYRSILKSIPSPVVATDKAGRCIYMNPAGLEIAGAKSLAQVLGKPCGQWPDNECRSLPDIVEGMQDAFQSFEFYHQSLNRHFRGEISLLFGPDGESSGAIEVMLDITEARAADERMRIMLEAMPLACTIWDEDGNTLDCNVAALSLFEAPDKTEFLRNFLRFFPERRVNGVPVEEIVRRDTRRAAKEGEISFFWEHITYTGKQLPVHVTLRRVDTPKGPIVVAYTEDLRKLRAKEAELDQERRLLRNVMDSSPVCFVIQEGGLVRFATPYALQFFGMQMGDRLANYFADVKEHRRFLREVRDKGALNWRVGTMRTADGSQREMLINAFASEYYGEPCIMSWFLDVTEMRNKERELSQARDLAEASTRAKSSFLANMSHEIRTPMNAILGMTRLVLDTRLPKPQRERLENVELSAKALLRVLNDILDFSKIEAGKLELELLEFNLRRELERIVDLTRLSALSKGLALSVKVDDEVPNVVVGDALRIGQVLTNLLSNAVKFTQAGRVDLHVSVPKVEGKRAWVRYTVRDTGIGLDSEQVATLFSAFTQADSSTTRRYGGTGLGLAISRKIAELMNGTLSCSGRPGEGAEFSFTVPLPVTNGTRQKTEENRRTCSTGLPEHLRGLRVLLAEDNELNRFIAREMLERIGFVVDEAMNGLEAVGMARKNGYAAIFMDIQMPGMDGFAATASLRRMKKFRELPIIAMTAHAMVGDKEKSLAAGMNGHLTKPLNEDELCRTAVELISGTELPRSDAQRDKARPAAVVNQTLGLRIMAGKRGLYHRLLARLASEIPNILTTLAVHMAEGRTEQAALTVHTLKGSAGNLGAEQLRAAAAAMEAALRMGDIATASGLLKGIKRAAAGYKRAVARIISREQDAV